MKFEKALNELRDTDEKSKYTGKDLSNIRNSLTYALKPLVSSMDKLTFDEIKEKFFEILDSPTVSVSAEAKKDYITSMNKISATGRGQKQGKYGLMDYICNIELAGSGLSSTKVK